MSKQIKRQQFYDVVNMLSDGTVGGRFVYYQVSYFPTQNSLVALPGGGQSGATQITRGVAARISTVASAGDSCLLQLDDVDGARTLVRNDGANSCDIFPPSGGQINSLGVNTAYALAAGSTVTFVCFTSGGSSQYYTF